MNDNYDPYARFQVIEAYPNQPAIPDPHLTEAEETEMRTLEALGYFYQAQPAQAQPAQPADQELDTSAAGFFLTFAVLIAAIVAAGVLL